MYNIVVEMLTALSDGQCSVKPSGTENLYEEVKMVSLLPTESNRLGEFYTYSISPLQPLKKKESSASDTQIMLNSRAKTVECI